MEVDLAVGYLPILDGPFERAALFEESYVVVARKDHALLSGSMSLERYCEADHLVVTNDPVTKASVDENLENLGCPRRVVAVVPLLFPTLETVASSDLIATLPKSFC